MTDNQRKAEQLLNKIRKTKENIKSKELEIEALRYKASGAGGIDYSKDRVQTTPQNFMEMAMADVVELLAEVEEDKAQLEELKCIAYSTVRKLENPEHRALIEWYYLHCVKMQDVCLHMNISERTAYYMKDDVLELFGALL